MSPSNTTTIEIRRVLSPEQAEALIGTDVGTDLEPTIASPRDGHTVRLIDADTKALVGVITRLDPDHRAALRHGVTNMRFGQDVNRRGKKGDKANMSMKGATFGYTPPSPMIRQDGCRAARTMRTYPAVAATLTDIAARLSQVFAQVHPEQAAHDRAIVTDAVLPEWRLNEDSLWTSGVINQTTILPYHRDGNNFDTWSAMPSIRYGMAGGHLHVPEYDLVFPTGDGDVTWFFGRQLVHGVTPMRHRRPDGYRYTIVFYAIRKMANCRTFAEETRYAALKRTERERKEAQLIREQLGLDAEPAVAPVVTDVEEIR